MKMFLAPSEHVDLVREELGPAIVAEQERLFLTKDTGHSFWAQNTWLDAQEFKFESISAAAKHVRAIQRNWWPHSVTAHRRASLIQEQLPPLKPKPIEFLAKVPTAPMGSWTLWDERTLYYAANCTSAFPNGEVHFIENKTPPSRAYLKLWEWFTLTGIYPRAGETALDLGASPGGWTWVLDQLGPEILSVDKAPLSPELKLSKRVTTVEESAFGMEPRPVDWFFSDIICYPERLLKLVNRWREAGAVKNFVCTIKFQGETDMKTVRDFAAIEGSRVQHLYANKHELTWSLINP